MSLRLARPASAAAAVVLGLVLAGCGADPTSDSANDSAGDEPASPASASGQAGAPSCEEVWVEDGDLSKRYEGCNAESGFVRADRLGCSSGQRMVRFDNRFYAVLGGSIHESESSLDKDIAYRDAVASCRG